MLNATALAYLPKSLGVVFLACVIIGLGEPGGLVVDFDRGFRVVLTVPAGVAGGGIPFTSAILEMLCDLEFRLRGGIFALEREEDAPLMCGDISGVWLGWITVVASSTRSSNMDAG